MSSGSSTAAGTGGNANESAVEEINDNESKAKEGKKCKVHTYSNIGVQRVYMELSGPVSN